MRCARAWQPLLFLFAHHPRGIHSVASPNSTTIVVLGQSMKPNGLPSATLVLRARKAADVYNQVGSSIIIPTGGDPANVGLTEAAAMRRLLKEQGIPDDSIILENQSRTTAQNALYVKPLLHHLGAHKVMLVTSDFHMPRASYIFEAVLQDDFVIHPQPAASGLPVIDAADGANINEKSLVQRLRLELHWIRRDLAAMPYLVTDLPDVRIPSPTANRHQHAIYEVTAQLEAAEMTKSMVDELVVQPGLSIPTTVVCVVLAMSLGMMVGCCLQRPACVARAYRSIKDTRSIGEVRAETIGGHRPWWES